MKKTNCQLTQENEVSKGATGIVYRINDSQVIKAYPESSDISKIKEEFKKLKIFYDLGIKCPKPYEIASLDNKIGIIMEYVKGETLTKHIAEKPSDAQKYIKEMVEMMKTIHSIDAGTLQIQSIKNKYRNALDKCKGYYSEEEIKKLYYLLESIPDEKTLLHGDYHTGNILLNENNELVVIDFQELGYGHPIFDIMSQGAIIPVTIENNKQLAEAYHNTNVTILYNIWKNFIYECYNPINQEEFNAFSKDSILYSRLKDAITKANAEVIPEGYLQLCADKTKSILLPEIERLTKNDIILKKTIGAKD